MKKDKNAFRFRNTSFRRFVVGFLRLFTHLFADIEVIHPERMQLEGAVMFAANHVVGYDAILMQLAIPRPLCFMSKAELFRNPLMAWFFNQIGSFPVKRGEFDRQSILNAKGVLDDGLALMMFPEGTRTFGNGMVEARSGTAHMAMRNHCAVIPAGLIGAEELFKHGFKRAKIQVRFGEKIEPGDQETAGQLTVRIMQGIAAELPPHLRGFYA
ncbi:MAG: 1-acyl-sn-glycerol-3-phosphate acyltransferase [Chloroflexota bacterium]|nr:1-acyl-sn-glycerol-3-phosphate acyltransferase [Chloroflexota bacterium]